MAKKPSKRKSAVDRLAGLLDRRDATIAKLKEEVARLTEGVSALQHKTSQRPKDFVADLPVPRLQLRYEPNGEHGWSSFRVYYELVYQHYLGVGAAPEADQCLVVVPLSWTDINGRNKAPLLHGAADLPFRDGAHFMSDSKQLNLPTVVLFRENGVHVRVPLRPTHYSKGWQRPQEKINPDSPLAGVRVALDAAFKNARETGAYELLDLLSAAVVYLGEVEAYRKEARAIRPEPIWPRVEFVPGGQ